MKKYFAFISIVFIACLTFSACGAGDVVYNGKYDSAKYTQVPDINGVSFLVPKEIFDKKESSANIGKYDAEKLSDHIFQAADAANYQIYQPGKFFMYVFDLGKMNGIQEKHDVSEISDLIGVTSWLKFQSKNPEVYTSTNRDGNTQVLYGAYITTILTASNSATSEVTYEGYVAILHNGETGKAYCLVIGYGEEGKTNTAKELAENFLLVQ